MYINIKVFLLLVLISFNSKADVRTGNSETWECTEPYQKDLLVTANSFIDKNSGELKVAGVVHQTQFGVKGFNRTWYFGLRENNEYYYLFTIKPNGDAFYYDFSNLKSGEKTAPSMILKCTQKSD